MYKKLILITLVILTNLKCEDDKISVPKLKPAEVFMTENSEYPAIAFDESGTTFAFSKDLTNTYVKLKSGEEWSVGIDPLNGRPTDMYISGMNNKNYYVVFSDFDGDRADVSISEVGTIMKSMGQLIRVDLLNTKHLMGVEFKGISNAKPLSNYSKMMSKSSIRDWWDDWGDNVLNMTGHVLGGVGCGMSLVGTTITFGASGIMAGIACGSFASSIIGEVTNEKPLTELGVAGTWSGAIVDCAKLDKKSCIMGLAGTAIGVYLLKKDPQVMNEAQVRADLLAYRKTGGLLGTWIGETKTQTNSGNGMTIKTTSTESITFTANACKLSVYGVVENTYSGKTYKSNYSTEINYRYTIGEVEYDGDWESISISDMNFSIMNVKVGGKMYTWQQYMNIAKQSGSPIPYDVNKTANFKSYATIFIDSPSELHMKVAGNKDDSVFKRK
jgi:hypothetical protein